MSKFKNLKLKSDEESLVSYIISILNRYGWARHPWKKQALADARVARGKYMCASCTQLFGPKDVAIDHVEPRIAPETGWVDYNTWIARTFTKNLQVLCDGCHGIKTAQESGVRAEHRRERKKK